MRTTHLAVALSLVLAIPAGAWQPPAAAPDPHAGHEGMNHPAPAPLPAPQAAPQANAAQSYFGEIPLVDQDGKTQRLYSDLIQDKVVVIDFMFTSCTGACPIMSNNFAKIQDWLGDRLGKEVYLLSVSVDPANDTPAKMKEYAARYKARPGWYFLTGSPENVGAALRKLGNYVENPEAHQNLFLIGNDKTGLWKKAFGLAEPDALIPVVQSVLEDKG